MLALRGSFIVCTKMRQIHLGNLLQQLDLLSRSPHFVASEIKVVIGHQSEE